MRNVFGIVCGIMLVSVLLTALTIRPVRGGPTTWTVDDDGPADYHTIQEAINAASSGDTIYAYNGTYHENLVVNKTLNLIGESRDSTVVDGDNYSCVMHLRASGVLVSNFTLQNGTTGIFGNHTGIHTIRNNIIQNNLDGIYLYGSSYNSLYDNLITGNNVGFRMDESYFNTFGRNEMTGNVVYNFYFDLWGTLTDLDFTQYVDTSNTVDGKPIIWWRYQASASVPKNAGLVVLYQSSGIIVEDLELRKNNFGIVTFYAGSCTIENVTVQDCETGIALHASSSNIIRENAITNNWNGLVIEYSFYNNVERNNIKDNEYGIITWDAYSNKIWRNNIMNNVVQLHNPEGPHYCTNTWDDGYPSGGNYWSDYSGTDFYYGPSQNETGSDGIGDNQHIIDATNIDNYPVMFTHNNPTPWDLSGPTTWTPDKKCDIRDIALLAKLYGSVVGDAKYNRRADLTGQTYLSPDLKIDIRDIALIAKHFGETYP